MISNPGPFLLLILLNPQVAAVSETAKDPLGSLHAFDFIFDGGRIENTNSHSFVEQCAEGSESLSRAGPGFKPHPHDMQSRVVISHFFSRHTILGLPGPGVPN